MLNTKDFSEVKVNVEQYRIKVDDIFKIDIKSQLLDNDLTQGIEKSVNNSAASKENYLYNGYQVDINGKILIPSVGIVKAESLTIEELRKKIIDLLVSNQVYTDPIVDIKMLNSHFTIIGEVNFPGRHEFLKNSLNIFEAIGIAGDLTINGNRKDIRIIRNIDSTLKISKLDLTKNVFEQKINQIYSGDIIIVNPNSTRVKNAGIIGNSGTLLSLLSFLLSSIIVISSN